MSSPRYRCRLCGKRVQARIAFSDEKAVAWPYKHKNPATGKQCPSVYVDELADQSQ